MNESNDNLFDTSQVNTLEETFIDILKTPDIHIEKIISSGQTSPKDFWYDQDKNEWVSLLKGEATIEYNDGSTYTLKSGEHLNIPAHQKHRVSKCSNPAIWLVVFY